MNHSSTPDACGERHAIGGHRRPRRGTSMLCDLHQRLRLPPSCSCRRDCVQRRERCVWTQRTPPIWLHSPQCAECNHVGGRAWVRPVRRRRWTQFCGIERGRFRRMPDGDHSARRETSLLDTIRVPTQTRAHCTVSCTAALRFTACVCALPPSSVSPPTTARPRSRPRPPSS